MLYFVLLSLATRDSDPEPVSDTKSGPGFPVTAIFVNGFTSMVTDWVTLLPCARTRMGLKSRRRRNKPWEVIVFTGAMYEFSVVNFNSLAWIV
jgi:hypothetical protein